MTIRNEASFLSVYETFPGDFELLPELTVGGGKAMLRRSSEDPPGAAFIPSVAYCAAAGETGQMSVYARRSTSERARCLERLLSFIGAPTPV